MARNLIKLIILIISAFLLNSNTVTTSSIHQSSDIEIIQNQEKTPPQLSLFANAQALPKILWQKARLFFQRNYSLYTKILNTKSLYTKSTIRLNLINYQNSQITALRNQDFLATMINIDAFIQGIHYQTNFTDKEHPSRT